MLSDILPRLAKDTGYHTVDNRIALLDLINRAAMEIYDAIECDHIYHETTLVVPPNKVIALPTFVGPIRGTRAHTQDVPFPVASIAQPRYTENTWRYKYRNWRDLGYTAIHTSLNVVGALTIETGGADTPPAVITISGQTALSDKVVESVTMDVNVKQTNFLFGLEIYSISSESVRLYNINIKDVDGNIIATLHNTKKQTKYAKIDVSQVFFGYDTVNSSMLADVLYKIPFLLFENDEDEFPALGYDDAIYFQAMALWATPQQGKEAIADNFRAKAIIAVQNAKNSTEGNNVKKLSFGRTAPYGYFKRTYGYNNWSLGSFQ